jgi:hypothetical protein
MNLKHVATSTLVGLSLFGGILAGERLEPAHAAAQSTGAQYVISRVPAPSIHAYTSFGAVYIGGSGFMVHEWVKVTLTSLGTASLSEAFYAQTSATGRLDTILSVPGDCFTQQVLVRVTDRIEGMSATAKIYPGCVA